VTEDDVRRIVLTMKNCLAPSHIACERCSPGYNERLRTIRLEDKPMSDAEIEMHARSHAINSPFTFTIETAGRRPMLAGDIGA
jgi:hypothetical protein